MDRPTLRDGDLVLRPATPADADAVTAACQDPEIARWTSVPSPLHARRRRVRSSASAPTRRRPAASIHLLAVDGAGTLARPFG